MDDFLEHLQPPDPSESIHAKVIKEVVIDKSGNVRQAGTTDPPARFIKLLKRKCESDLYFFAKSILGQTRLVPHLHKVVCAVIMKHPPYRKLLLLPRDTFKTTLVAKSLPIHKFIQPKDNNAYWPGHDGLETKILLTCETAHHAEKHILWIEQHFERNQILRTLWPEKCWEKPKRDARKWNSGMFYLPRELRFEQSDPTMQGIGVGGAITGSHVTDIINDDLISLEAAQSEAVMDKADEWQVVSRALMEDQETSQEYTIGTHWAVNDLYVRMQQRDPTIEVYKRSLVENGKSIFPEEFSMPLIEQFKSEYGFLFPLLYMNNPKDSGLVDFKEEHIRRFRWVENSIVFDADDRDRGILDLMAPKPIEVKSPKRFRQLTGWDDFKSPRDEYLNLKYS